MKEELRMVERMLLVSIGAVVALTVVFFSGCPPVVKTVLDVNDAVCKVLDKDLQDEPEYVKLECAAVESIDGERADGGAARRTFIVRIPRTQAKALAAEGCR